jgi:hypothetical protein
MRRANRKDLVHKAIVEGLRAYGILVADMPSPGDVLCFNPRTKVFLPIEFKSDQTVRGGKPENISNNKIKTPTLPIPIAHSLAEALALLGIGL